MEWERLACAFPLLGSGVGPQAARARRELGRLCSRALRTGRWQPRLDGPAPDARPTVFLTAHFGSLSALRYCLRARGVPAAIAVGPHNFPRADQEESDRLFDSRFPMGFPHVFEAERAHRLRTALGQGSLLVVADLPGRNAVESDLLGGRVRLDPRPIRLARVAGVRCCPAFLSLPEAGWTLTVGPELPPDEGPALGMFGRIYANVAARAPWDLDGVVYRSFVEPR